MGVRAHSAELYEALTFEIALDASLSGGIDLQGAMLLALQMPAAWTTANLTFQGSYDGVTYSNIYDIYGTEYTVVAAAARYIPLEPDKMAGVRYLKIRSGTAASAVNQAAARSLMGITKVL